MLALCACASAPDPEDGSYRCVTETDCIEGFHCSGAGICVVAGGEVRSDGGADAGAADAGRSDGGRTDGGGADGGRADGGGADGGGADGGRADGGRADGGVPIPVHYAAHVRYAAGHGPTDIDIADLDADGDPDVAFAGNAGKTIGTLFNRGDGTFAPATEYTSTSFPTQIHAGDLNGDGAVDLVDNLGFHLNRGDGTFGVETAYGAIGTSLALADLDDDRRLDIAIIQPGSRSLHVVRGNGNATFGARVTYTTGEGPTSVAVADLDRNGLDDVILALAGSSGIPGHAIDVFLGARSGGFRTRVEYDVAVRIPVGIAAADLDGDGALDVVVGARDEQAIGVVLGNGDGTFRTASTYPTLGTFTVSVVAADLNGDGALDVAVTHLTGGTGVLLNRGDGTLAPETLLRTGNGQRGVAIRDLNKDARPDIVVANQQDDSLSVLLQVP